MDQLADVYKNIGIEKWIGQYGIGIATTIIVAVILFYIGSGLLAKLVKQAVKSTAKHRDWHRKDMEKRQKTLSALFVSIWRIMIIIYVAVSILTTVFRVDLGPLFASAGIIGVALGFGAQSLIKDFLSGIFIIAENQYRVGDIIAIEGASGTVERIGTRSTVIRDIDGNVHYFPNGMVMHVINKTMGYSMARFNIAIHPSSNIDEVTEIIDRLGVELAAENEWKNKIIKAPAFVSIGEFTGTSVDLQIAGKTQPSDQWAVIAEMRKRLLEALERANIKLAITPSLLPTPTVKK
ncbi:MAG: mechanosensitive ion channel family protein [Candidatus Saccharimonadales bacterium]